MKPEELFDAYLRQELDETQMENLLHQLQENENLKKDFFAYIDETSCMIQCATDLQHEQFLPKKDEFNKLKSIRKEPVQKIRKVNFALLSSIAAIFIFALVFFNQTSSNNEILTYRITEANAENFTLSALSTEQSITLNSDEYLSLINASGSRIRLIGPVQAQFIHDKNIALKSGRISVSLSDEDKGFLLSNPIKNIYDIGTAFGAHLNEKNLDLHVFQGLVEFGKKNKILVKEKESYSYSQQNGFSSIAHLSKQVFYSKLNKLPELKFKVLAGEDYYLKLNDQVNELEGSITIVNYNPNNPRVMLQIFADDEFIQGVQFTKSQREISINLKDLADTALLRFNLKGSNNDIPTLFADVSFPQHQAKQILLATKELISDNAQWSYYKAEAAPVPNWKRSASAPALWKKSPASFAYSDKATTEISEDNHPLHLRHDFDLDTLPAKHAKLILSMRVDDGVIIYLNGQEVQRLYLPLGALSQQSRANYRTKSEAKFTTFIIPTEHLQEGQNILSASVYQYEKKSSDMFFNARLLLLE
ncbi:hypothetical protein PQO03_08330 [Lentisphaera profundi]|uniref:FecR protein domain-containing protein n=1 Tax=Lentisphaera profundi TaxID=1658616 RepID=A0ABY7VNM0_9BACT|nr:hypothetical protein [Lentisphaera profundi]WDE95721.1 hypothetical protein PQO03_08330 [Lentisphaera profundi]